MLQAGDPVDIKLWTKSREIQCCRKCIPRSKISIEADAR